MQLFITLTPRLAYISLSKFSRNPEHPEALGCMGACTVSRQVYVKLNHHFLPGGSKSRIYYNAKDTIVYIENFTELIENSGFGEGILGRYWTQQWFNTIQNLAVPFESFTGSNRRSANFCWSGHLALPRMLRRLTNLEHLVGIVRREDYGRLELVGYFTPESQKLYLAHEITTLQNTLGWYNRAWNMNKVVAVSFIDA
jgi:hypothetical protein